MTKPKRSVRLPILVERDVPAWLQEAAGDPPFGDHGTAWTVLRGEPGCVWADLGKLRASLGLELGQGFEIIEKLQGYARRSVTAFLARLGDKTAPGAETVVATMLDLAPWLLDGRDGNRLIDPADPGLRRLMGKGWEEGWRAAQAVVDASRQRWLGGSAGCLGELFTLRDYGSGRDCRVPVERGRGRGKTESAEMDLAAMHDYLRSVEGMTSGEAMGCLMLMNAKGLRMPVEDAERLIAESLGTDVADTRRRIALRTDAAIADVLTRMGIRLPSYRSLAERLRRGRKQAAALDPGRPRAEPGRPVIPPPLVREDGTCGICAELSEEERSAVGRHEFPGPDGRFTVCAHLVPLVVTGRLRGGGRGRG